MLLLLGILLLQGLLLLLLLLGLVLGLLVLVLRLWMLLVLELLLDLVLDVMLLLELLFELLLLLLGLEGLGGELGLGLLLGLERDWLTWARLLEGRLAHVIELLLLLRGQLTQMIELLLLSWELVLLRRKLTECTRAGLLLLI